MDEAYVICDHDGKNCSTLQEFLPRDKNVSYIGGSVFAKNDDGSTTRIGSYRQIGDYEDATGSLLAFVGFARSALTGLLNGAIARFSTSGTKSAANGIAGSIRNVNPTGGIMNCVNCAIATDATLAGRAASTMPGSATSIAVLEQHFGGQFVKMASKQSIDQAMQAAGPGARAIVFGERAGGIGHVFNAVNQGGVVRYLDGQTGQVASFAGYTALRLLRTN